MKHSASIVLIVLVVLLTASWQGGLAGAGRRAEPLAPQAGAPTVISYQGQITVAGVAYSGTGYFKFAIVNAAGTTSYWSNDSTSVAGSEPTASVPLPVTNGLFNVLLGDDSLDMKALDAGVFEGPDRALRVWFAQNPDGPFAWLSPDRRIAAVPYALQAEEASNADLLDGQHGSAFQNRVSGACAVGSTIRGVNADGTAVCQVDAPLNRPIQPLANTLTALDSGDDVGRHTSITIGADGLGLTSYRDMSNGNLKVAHCNDAACASASLATLDSAGVASYDTSIAIGADGLGLIAYESTGADLKIAHCNDAACASASLATVDSAGDVGWHTSLTIGADGLGLISYFDESNGDLKVAHCANAFCIPYFRRR